MEIPSFLQTSQSASSAGQTAQNRPAFDLTTATGLNAKTPRDVTTTYNQNKSNSSSGGGSLAFSKPLPAPSTTLASSYQRGDFLNVMV